VANSQSFQNYFAPEIHSPLRLDEDNTFALTMSNSADAGKAPMGAGPPTDFNGGGGRYGGTNLISVEPPKQSDLQVSSYFGRTRN
jgi:hypothetical protein